MNNGRICIPVFGETAAEMIRKIREAEQLADVIELRFDGLNNPSGQTLNEVFKHKSGTPWLATFRPKDQGGSRELSLDDRMKFWNTGHRTEFADMEWDIINDVEKWEAARICSHHDFSAVPKNLGSIFDHLCQAVAGIIKIAVGVEDTTEAVAVWKLLERAKTDKKQMIPIAMGEAGKWTRILGLGHGAFLTYASLETGNETAPGQISAEDMLHVYRVKELDQKTNVYGIIAGNTSYTTSPFMHNAAFRARGMNAVFVPFQVRDLDDFMRRMVISKTRAIDLNLKGFSITNPHKQTVTKYLDVIDETARKIGAVNTVRIHGEKLHGFNTDSFGFIEPLKQIYGSLTNGRVAVMGAGGAARAVIYSLKQENTHVTVFARDPRRAASLAAEFDVDIQQLATDHRSPIPNFDIIVNATPLGTKGENEDKTIAVAEQLKDANLVYDLVYNPSETRLMAEARAAGIRAINGLEMVVRQGAQQFKIWTGQDAPIEEMRSAVAQRLFN